MYSGRVTHSHGKRCRHTAQVSHGNTQSSPGTHSPLQGHTVLLRGHTVDTRAGRVEAPSGTGRHSPLQTVTQLSHASGQFLLLLAESVHSFLHLPPVCQYSLVGVGTSWVYIGVLPLPLGSTW